MAYQFERNETPDDAVRRIAREEITDALDSISDDQLAPAKAVHNTRKHCKKLRGLVRLVRPALGAAYSRENSWFRDIGRLLAPSRDTEVIRATLDELSENLPAEERSLLSDLGQKLTERGPLPEGGADAVDASLAEVRERLLEAAERIPEWPSIPAEFATIAEGFARSYRRGRRGLETVEKNGTVDPESNHEWRKRVKYHWYQVRLLQEIWLPVLSARAEETHHLSRLLGSEHDLVVLHAAAENESDPPVDADSMSLLERLISSKRRHLMSQALPLGERIYAEKPSDLVARLSVYWEAHCREYRNSND